MEIFQLRQVINLGAHAQSLYKKHKKTYSDTPDPGGMFVLGMEMPPLVAIQYKDERPLGLLATAWMEKGKFRIYDGRTFAVFNHKLEKRKPSRLPLIGDIFGMGRWKASGDHTFFHEENNDLERRSYLAFFPDRDSDITVATILWTSNPGNEKPLLRGDAGWSHSFGKGFFGSPTDDAFRGRIYAEWSALPVSDGDLLEAGREFINRAKLISF